MIISSRTPEGEPNHCPICKAEVRIEPSVMFGDAPCPNCGHLLWFLRLSGDTLLADYESSRPLHNRVAELLADMDLAADSLDLVELVMELENEEGFFQA